MMENLITFLQSPVGSLRISSDGDYINSIKFVDDHVVARQDQHPLLDKCVDQLQQYFHGKSFHFDLPVLQPGTEFQKTIWDLLMKIPFGKTISYKQLTSQFGDMKAIRAVASANGRNDLAIIVPCHRVIGTNGSLTGYAGGLWRKKWLLGHESRFRQMEIF